MIPPMRFRQCCRVVDHCRPRKSTRVPEFSCSPKAAPSLAAALATGADFLITGDKDLRHARNIAATRPVNRRLRRSGVRLCKNPSMAISS